MQMKNLSDTTARPPNLLRKVAALAVTLVLFGLVLMFSVLLFAFVLTVGVVAWGYLWWRTRALRKQMRMYSQDHSPDSVILEGEVIEGEVVKGDVIEGEFIRGEDYDERK
jgi:ABC-type bacteriocin/lantibiotic exporter with double-glycine peptidase domain